MDRRAEMLIFDTLPQPVQTALRQTVVQIFASSAKQALDAGLPVFEVVRLINKADKSIVDDSPWR